MAADRAHHAVAPRLVSPDDLGSQLELIWNVDTTKSDRKLLTAKALRMVEAGESEYSGVLKTRKLLTFRDAKNAEPGEIAPNWNVSGTRDFSFLANFVKFF